MPKENEEAKKTQNLGVLIQKCGIVMPISAIDGCSEQHWADVLEILTESIESAGFEPNLVSNADDVGIIQKRIIQNLYENPIIVCDVSGKNPNVMFELGMRLAFDKPTIIIKDDQTTYSFDTSPIEHISYPRDLRFNKIVEFKKDLVNKIKGTAKKAKEDNSFSTFLKHFGKFTVAKLDTTEISKEEFILEEIRDLRQLIFYLSKSHRLNDLNRIERKNLNQETNHGRSHTVCREILEAAIIQTLNENSTNTKKIKNKNYLKKHIINKIINQKSTPNCFDPNNSICQKMIEKMIDEFI